MTAQPTDYLRRIWYDCITYDLGALRYLISVVGAERVLFGTDWPHQVHDVAGSLANTGRACRRISATRSAAVTRCACSSFEFGSTGRPVPDTIVRRHAPFGALSPCWPWP